MKRLMILVAAVALVAGALVLSPTARAESGSQSYRRGHAPAAIDITRLQVSNGATRVRMRVHVRDLGTHGKFVFAYWRGTHGYPPARSLQVVVHRVDGETVARFLTCGREDCAGEKCAGVRGAWHPRADVVEVVIPQRCYPRKDGTEPPRVGRFFASAYQGQHDDFGADRPLRLSRA